MDDEGAFAAVALPSAMAAHNGGGYEDDDHCDGGGGGGQLVGTDVNVANVTLNDGMKPVLQRFCDAARSPAEKAKALELLTALELSSAIKEEAADGRPRIPLAATQWRPDSRGGQHPDDTTRRTRPRTAVPRLESAASCEDHRRRPAAADGGGALSYVNSYETTHDYYYQPPLPSPSKAVRPASSQMQRVVPPATELAPGNSFGDLFMTTTYGREFFAKSEEARRPPAERAASARGVRNNNPHPNREFLVWRYRRPMTATDKIESAQSAVSEPSPHPQQQQQRRRTGPELTNESFDRAVRGKCRSTYQHDYLGVQGDFDVSQRAVSLLAVEDQAAPAYDRSSVHRGAFVKPPPVPPVMAVPRARFGQNPAQATPGVIPAGGLSGGALFGTRTRTTYEAHICDPAGRMMRVADLRQLSNAQNARAVGRMLDGVSGSERAALMKLYREMQSRSLPASIPLPVERRIIKERVGGHMRGASTGQPAWLSTWTGPA